MAVNKVVYDGRTIIYMTDATATSETVLKGYSAYGANGVRIAGTVSATTRQEVTISLPLSEWVDGQQIISIPGVMPESTIIVGSDIGSEPTYSDCGIYCSNQGTGSLTFTAAWLPDSDLIANAVILN